MHTHIPTFTHTHTDTQHTHTHTRTHTYGQHTSVSHALRCRANLLAARLLRRHRVLFQSLAALSDVHLGPLKGKHGMLAFALAAASSVGALNYWCCFCSSAPMLWFWRWVAAAQLAGLPFSNAPACRGGCYCGWHSLRD